MEQITVKKVNCQTGNRDDIILDGEELTKYMSAAISPNPAPTSNTKSLPDRVDEAILRSQEKLNKATTLLTLSAAMKESLVDIGKAVRG